MGTTVWASQRRSALVVPGTGSVWPPWSQARRYPPLRDLLLPFRPGPRAESPASATYAAVPTGLGTIKPGEGGWGGNPDPAQSVTSICRTLVDDEARVAEGDEGTRSFRRGENRPTPRLPSASVGQKSPPFLPPSLDLSSPDAANALCMSDMGDPIYASTLRKCQIP